MVLQAVYWKGDTLLKYDRHTAKQTNERYLISQKLISEQDQIMFSDKYFSVANNDYSTPEELSKFIDNKSPSHLYLHTNISLLSYNIDDLASFILNCRKRPRIIGISECCLKANQESLSNISLKNRSSTNLRSLNLHFQK